MRTYHTNSSALSQLPVVHIFPITHTNWPHLPAPSHKCWAQLPAAEEVGTSFTGKSSLLSLPRTLKHSFSER